MSIIKVFKTDYVGFVIKYACILIGTRNQLRYYRYIAGNAAVRSKDEGGKVE